MESHNEESYSVGDLVKHTGLFLGYLLRKWPFYLLAVILGGLSGLGFYALQKPKYEAECTFILEEKQNGLGGLSGIASQFGLDIGGMSGGGMFSGDNILAILSSKSILENVLLSKVDTGNTKKLIEYYLDFSGLRHKWAGHPSLESIQFNSVKKLSDLTSLQDSVMNIVYRKVVDNHLSVERVSKKGTIISVKTVSEDPGFSRLLVKRLVDASRDYYIGVKTSVTVANVARLQRKADSLLYLLSNKTYQAAVVQGVDLNPGIRTLSVPVEIASRDKTILATLYTEVVKNLEIARTTLMLQTPVLEVLDVPTLSLYDNKKRKLFFIAIGVLAFTVLASVFLFIKYQVKSLSEI